MARTYRSALDVGRDQVWLLPSASAVHLSSNLVRGIHKEARGRGHSRQLVDALLASRPEAFASLTSRPGAQAHAMYQRWGWEKIGSTQTYAHWPVEDISVLPLRNSALREDSQ
ncbi:hypothetical protein GCM10009745_47940 [Kribbella yunnanensis]|uniref:N-acetyltransferase n=1 Tax=Kribbella yunnanensis TaxID=190194 RepID=A0ABP4TZC8_9ACTN